MPRWEDNIKVDIKEISWEGVGQTLCQRIGTSGGGILIMVIGFT